MANSLVEKYSNEIAPAMNKKFNYDSVMEIPKIDKIVLIILIIENFINSFKIIKYG